MLTFARRAGWRRDPDDSAAQRARQLLLASPRFYTVEPEPPRSPMPAAPVLCFGELLWDFLPHGAFPGGAPCNVAYHLHRLGVPVLPVSAVGQDELGDQLLAQLSAWGIATTAIARHPVAPTGRVIATVTSSGDAHYTIAASSAWDFISAQGPALAAAREAPAFVFGSLALRSPDNRQAIARLAATLPPRRGVSSMSTSARRTTTSRSSAATPRSPTSSN